MNTQAKNLQHPFEKTLGAGPYRFVGAVQIRKPTATSMDNYKSCYDAAGPRFVTGMGTCAHCGMAIMNVFLVEIGNGDVFGVGCDCIGKVGMAPQEIRKVDATVKKWNKEKQTLKAFNARADLEEMIESQAEVLGKLPHPMDFEGKSLLDYAVYMDRCAGSAGKQRAVKVIKKAMAI